MENFLPYSREVRKHWVYKDSQYFHVWSEMLLTAKYTDCKELINGQIVEIKQGQFIFGLNSYSERLGIPVQRLRTFMKKATEDGMIVLTLQTNKYSLYSLTNWSKFNMQTNTQSNTIESSIDEVLNDNPTIESTPKATPNQHPTNTQPTTYNKEKKEKKEKKVVKKELIKMEYAPYIFLAEDEHTKLTDLLGEVERDNYFLRFSSWISGKTKREQDSRSAYLTILNWHREDQKKVVSMQSRNSFQQSSPYMRTKSKLQQMQEEAEANEDAKAGHHQTYTNPFS